MNEEEVQESMDEPGAAGSADAGPQDSEPQDAGPQGEASTGSALFEEIQQPPWPAMALGLGGTATGAIAAARALSMFARFGVAALAVGGLGVVLTEFMFPMRTTLLPEELQVRFGRRTRFRIPLKNVVRAYARTYQPLAEYGGWGIRGVGGNRAFNMRGNEGVQLELRSGQKVLIGSEKPEELVRAIRKATGCSS